MPPRVSAYVNAPTSELINAEQSNPPQVPEDHAVVVGSSSHQSPSLCASRFRSALTISILLSVWSASKGSRKEGGCHEANDLSRDNGCALSDRL